MFPEVSSPAPADFGSIDGVAYVMAGAVLYESN